MDGAGGGSKSRCNMSVHGQHSSVTVNNGSGGRQVLVTPLSSVQRQAPSGSFATTAFAGHQRQVLTTPLTMPQSTSTLRPRGQTFIDKAILNAVCQSAKKDVSRAFTLRNIDTARILSCDDLKSVIRRQLQHDIVSDDFDVGYVQGTGVVRVQSKEDLIEMWTDLGKPNSKMTLWCDGLKDSVSKPRACRKRKQSEGNSDDEDSTLSGRKKKKQPSRKEEEVQELVESLKQKHASSFTQMQYRIWGEMIAGGLHASTDDPPSTSTFTRAGSSTPFPKNVQSPVAQLLTDAAVAITSALSPKPNASPSSVTPGSPAKLIESRSKLYK